MSIQLKSERKESSSAFQKRARGDLSLGSTDLGIKIPNRNVAREMLMKTVVFGRRGLLPMVMSWNKDEQNMGAMPTTGHSRFEIKPQGRSRAKAGMKAKMDMRRS